MRSFRQLGFLLPYKITAEYLFLTLALGLWCPNVVSAQSVSLTGPLAPVSVGEGDDFATRVLGNTWDMNQASDIGWEEAFSSASVGVNGGVWQGTNSATGAYVLPLFPDFKGALHSVPFPGERTLPSPGVLTPVEASKYSYLCYRLNASSRSSFAIYWSNDPAAAQYWPDGSNRAVKLDGTYTQSGHVVNSGWRIYCHNMLSLAGNFDQIGGSWSGNIMGLRIDPSVFAPAGSTLSIDWVRLVDPASAPNINISWNQSGLMGNDVVTVYVDNNNSGNDGTPIRSWSRWESPGSFQLPSAALPPGSYHFYVGVRRYDSNGNPVAAESFSGYSAAVSISSAPQGFFTAPSMSSGDEYFFRETGNALDMSGAEDVPNLAASYPPILRQFSNPAFISHAEAQDGQVFMAQADPPLPGNPHGDNQIHLPVSSSKRIDPSHYRYFAFRMFVDPSQYGDLADRVNYGWVSRPVWWNGPDLMVNSNAGDPGATVLRTGWQNHYIDLATIPQLERGTPWPNKTSWEHMRFDPLENPVYTWFWLDWVRLYSENRTSNNEYTISFNIADADSGSVNVALYYDTDKSGFDGTLIANMNGLAPGNHSYVWNTAALPVNTSYYVYMVVTDGSSTARYYSSVHVKTGDYTGGGVGQSARIRGDHNADGLSEVCLARSGVFKKRVSRKHVQINCKDQFGTSISSPLLNVGLANSKLVEMDMDGDLKADWVVVNEVQPNSRERKRMKKTGVKIYKPVDWVIHSSQGTRYKIRFGQTDDIPVPGDYYGSGSENIAMFRGGWWLIRKSDGSTDLQAFGQSGDLPAQADYDGDGKTDLGIFRPSTGEFWYKKSSNGVFASQSFGASGDLPVPQDIDGDGKADFVVWRASEAQFYIRQSSNDAVFGIPLGGGSHKPMKNYDMDGDGKMDLVQYWNNGSFLAQTSGAAMLSINVGSAGHVAPESY